jgi:choline dehydrogenase-like flavoprotein
VVFLLESPLIDQNTLQVRAATPGSLPQIDVNVAPAPQNRTAQMDQIADEFIATVQGTRVQSSYSQIGGVGHEVGTLRMDRTGNRDGVVDGNLKVHGYDNLYVCDLSVFPSSPAANPTLTLAALALRLADHL